MNARQEAKLTMCRTVEQLCDANTSIISTVAAFMTAFTTFKAVIADILGIEQIAGANIAGITVGKVNSKQTLAEITAEIGGIIYAYAAATKDETLKEEVNFRVFALLRTRDEQLAPRCQLIHDRAVANKAALADYGITDAKIAALQTAINDYSAKTPNPRNAVSNRKTQNANLTAKFRLADAILKDQMDRLIKNFAVTNPDFVQTYTNARIIIDAPTTTTQLKGTVTDSADNAPIKGATVTIVELGKTRTTDTNGKYSFKPVQNGEFTITVTKQGYTDAQTDNVEVKLGVPNVLDVSLLKLL